MTTEGEPVSGPISDKIRALEQDGEVGAQLIYHEDDTAAADPRSPYAQLEARHVQLSTYVDGLVLALQKCREERDMYAAQLREMGEVALAAERKLESHADELDSLAKWAARIAARLR